MGTISKGILGGFSGTVGPIVGASWNGIDYIRSRPYSAKRIPSPAQQAQQARFGLMVSVLRPLNSFLGLSFRRAAKGMSGFNLAVRYNILNAINGAYPDFTVDHTRLKLSHGWLPNAGEPQAVSTDTGRVSFTWKNNSGVGNARPGDKTLLVVYEPVLGRAAYKCFGASRYEQADTLELPAFSGLKTETYISFIAQNGITADSIYTGSVIVL